MRFLMLIYGGQVGENVDLGAGERLDSALLADGVLTRTVPSAAARRTDASGYWLVDCEDGERAVALAEELAATTADAVQIEIRPLMRPHGLEM